MKDKNNLGGYLGSTLALVLSTIQTNEVAEWISFGIGVLSALFSIAYTIYKWYEKAKADGKITPDEVKDLKEDIEKEKGKYDKQANQRKRK